MAVPGSADARPPPHTCAPSGGSRLRAVLLGFLLAVVGPGLVACERPSGAASTRGIDAPAPEEGYADLAAAVMPAVVNVRVQRTLAAEEEWSLLDDPDLRRFFERFFGQPLPRNERSPPSARRVVGVGSGFIISPDGHVVTAYHVAGAADRISVSLGDGTVYSANVQGEDEATDLVLLKVEAGRPLPYVTWGDSDKARVGDRVIAVGDPFGLGGTVTAGIVSATGRELGEGSYEDFLQIDAAINRGNSGGPTFDMRGEVLGVNTAIISPTGGSIGIGFAIASNQARQIVNELMRHGSVERGFLGVEVQALDEDLATMFGLERPEGALVTKVDRDGPAAMADLRRGDVIVALEGAPVLGPRQLTWSVAATPAGRTVRLAVWRDGRFEMVAVQIGRLPPPRKVANGAPAPAAENRSTLGLGLAPLTQSCASASASRRRSRAWW